MKQTVLNSQTEKKTVNEHQKYFTFLLNNQVYAICSIEISEIINYQKPTLLPGAPAHVKGLINLRGKLIPVVSLKEKMGFLSTEKQDKPVIVVLLNQSKGKYLGLIVDSALDVRDLNVKDINESTGELNKQEESLVSYFAIDENEASKEVILILDIEKLYELFSG